MSELSWHQQNAIARRHKLRNHAAHIQGANYIVDGKSLCGAKNFPVWVLPEHAHNPANKVCKKCLAKLGRINVKG